MPEPTMQTTVVDGATKYTIAFPLTDETGQPLLDRKGSPRFTNLIADSPEELVTKIAQANLEISRALDRSQKHIETLKNKKPTPARAPVDLKPKTMTADEQMSIGLDLQDPRKAAAAIEKVVESRVAPVVNVVEQQSQALDIEERRRIALAFFRNHPEYSTSANGGLLAKWLSENGYEFTLDNIEIAFATIQDRLARIPPPAPAPPNALPDNAPPANEPNPGTPPAQPRRAPVGGIRSDQATGIPARELTLTRAQALEMLHKRPREYEQWMQDPKRNAILNRALAGR